VQVTVIIPFHKNLGQLQQSLWAVRRSMQDAEIVVAADGALDDCRPLASAAGAIVVDVAGPSGPATARNRAAAVATGEVLVFVDTDVVVTPAAIPGMCRFLNEQPGIVGVFGAYDLEPPEPNFMSQFKNLSHAYVHEVGAGEASTFWAGLGAVRADVFRNVGGFDERFARPSIEDIELGYRLVAPGHRLWLEPRFRGTHLKRWTWSSSVVTDVTARGIPWTQLIHRSGAPKNRLNLSRGLRWSVVCAYLTLIALSLVLMSRWFLPVAAGAGAILVVLNIDYYRWLARQRGTWFAIKAIPAHFVHHLCNGFSFAAGTVLWLASRAGVSLPGALPTTVWKGRSAPGPSGAIAE
jgi:GT2 family glycosyltransferase